MPTDPTPQAGICKCHYPDRWGNSPICRYCNKPLYSPAEPSPAPQAERVIEVAPQGEIPTAFDQSRGWEAIIKWAYANNDDGVLAVRDIAREFVDWRTRAQTAESALTAAREEANTRYTEWQAMSLTVEHMREERDRSDDDATSMGKMLGDARKGLRDMTEERDRARDALRAIRLRVNRQFAVKTIDEYFALKPVSDRQPEGETK